MSEPKPSASSDNVLVRVNEMGYTEFHHRPCGKVWSERGSNHSPNYCPGCGEELFEIEDQRS